MTRELTNAQAKELVVKTIGELATMRAESESVWRTLYLCIDLARSLDIAEHAAEAGDERLLTHHSDVVEQTIQTILVSVALWHGEVAVSRGTPKGQAS